MYSVGEKVKPYNTTLNMAKFPFDAKITKLISPIFERRNQSKLTRPTKNQSP